MSDVYIRAVDLNRWIIDRLPRGKDLYSVDDLINAIEDMDSELVELQENYDKLEERFDEYRHDNPPRY